MIIAAVIVAAIGGVWALKSTVVDPFRTVQPIPVSDFMQSPNSIVGNTYKLDGIVGEKIRDSAGGRIFSVEVQGDFLPVVVPASLREQNIEKGQRYLFKVEVRQKGILQASEVKKN
jgi:hypothetical protein